MILIFQDNFWTVLNFDYIIYNLEFRTFNPFPHMDSFWRLTAADSFLKT